MELIDKVKEIFGMKLDWEIDDVFVFSNEHILLNYIEPHKGTEWKYLIRIDYKDNFDRWSVAWYEKYIENIYDSTKVDELLNDIKLIIENKDKILVKVPTDDPFFEEGYYFDLDREELEKLNLSMFKD